ncbi:YgiT-type zinc finger protein [Bacillus sp. PAMC26568]|nr:YgiT-type zinc finger protein [Bacillus sp. PAMC26568]
MLQFPCTCGGKANIVVGTVVHRVNGKEISIHNIPHYQCSDCGNIEYDIKQVKVTPVLRKAINLNLDEIDYIDFKNKLEQVTRTFN